MLMEPSSHSIDSAHPQLVLSKEVLIAANYKLIVAQPFFKFQNNGWKDQNGTWSSENSGLPLEDCTYQTLSPASSFFPVPHNASLKPCLYDIRKDPSERHNLAEQLPAIVEELWAALNTTILTQRDCRCATHALLSPHLWCHTKLRHAPSPCLAAAAGLTRARPAAFQGLSTQRPIQLVAPRQLGWAPVTRAARGRTGRADMGTATAQCATCRAVANNSQHFEWIIYWALNCSSARPQSNPLSNPIHFGSYSRAEESPPTLPAQTARRPQYHQRTAR